MEEVELDPSTPWEAQAERLKMLNVKGETLSLTGGEKAAAEVIKKLKMRTVLEQNLEGIRIIYGYTPRLRGYVVIDGSRINVQIAVREDAVTVGTPLILGSY